jgi:hypothetical protein
MLTIGSMKAKETNEITWIPIHVNSFWLMSLVFIDIQISIDRLHRSSFSKYCLVIRHCEKQHRTMRKLIDPIGKVSIILRNLLNRKTFAHECDSQKKNNDLWSNASIFEQSRSRRINTWECRLVNDDSIDNELHMFNRCDSFMNDRWWRTMQTRRITETNLSTFSFAFV